MEDSPPGQLVGQDGPARSGRTDSDDTDPSWPDPAPGTSTAPDGIARTGGRRYRTGPPPLQRRRADEEQRAQTAPLPSGLGARGTLGALVAWCLASCLLATWLHHAVVAGLGFCLGSALAARYCRPAALLRMVVAVPAVFAVAEIVAQVATLHGGRRGLALPVAGGTLLTLAAVAPWLFAGTAAAVAIALFRGLPQCVRDLRAELRGGAPRRTPRGPRGRRGPPAEQALRAQQALRALNAQRAQRAPRG